MQLRRRWQSYDAFGMQDARQNFDADHQAASPGANGIPEAEAISDTTRTAAFSHNAAAEAAAASGSTSAKTKPSRMTTSPARTASGFRNIGPANANV
jgi:hypothetical protein